MAVYIGHDECQVIYVARNGQQLRVSSVWVGDQQVFPPANRQEIHVFTRDTQGYGRAEESNRYLFSVPVPWWATNADVVMIGAGEKGRDGTKSITGGSDGAGGRSGAWVVKTVAVPNSPGAYVTIGKGNSTSPHYTEVIFPSTGGPEVRVWDGEGTRTPNSGSTGGYVTPLSRTEYGHTHAGAGGGQRNSPGRHPGGGGGGGQGAGLIGNPTSGREGGDGYVWLRFRSDAPIGGGGFTLYVGVASGAAYQAVRDWAASIGKAYQTITEITVPVEVIGPSLSELFYGCSALTTAPDMDTSQVTNMGYVFDGCSSLVNVPQYDTSNAERMARLFYGCASLKALPPMQAGNVEICFDMFTGCTSLESVTLPGMGESLLSGQTLNMRDTKLNPAAANALMQSLGTPPPGGTLQLPSTASGADRNIAESKNWQVTIA